MIVIILIILSSLLYAGAFVCAAIDKKNAFNISIWLAWVAFLSQGAALAIRQIECGTVFATSYDLLETFVFAFVACVLFCRSFLGIKFLEFFSMLPISILTILPVFCPVFADALSDRAVSKIGSEAATMHGILAAFSYAAMGMACLFACMYLIQKRLLQKKMSNKFGALIPSIGLLYKALRASATSAFVFMFASILFAVAAIKPESADATQIFKFSIGFAVFAIQGALCFAVKRRIFSEGKAAPITLAATAICLLLLLAMELKKFII